MYERGINTEEDKQRAIKGQIYSRRNYFNDGQRKIDFVLVSSIIKLPSELDILCYFMTELTKFGIEYEISPGEASPNLIFIKLHCPKHVLEEYADYQHFVFDYKNPRILQRRNRYFPCSIFHNVTTEFRPNHPAYNRAYGSLSSNKPRHITSWERAMLVHKILMMTKFSEQKHDEGINKLMAIGVLMDAYPTHDGPYEWHDEGPLTDRQLLYKYWASLLAMFKHQPIPLIFKYFGPEVAFYFAFGDFYTKMLVVPAILGVVLMIFNAFARDYWDTARVSEICESDMMLCTLCFYKRSCNFTPLKHFCIGAYILPVFDNIGGGVFAVFMGFWSIAFLELWKRQEYMLKFRWNLINVESDTAYRLEFLKTATHTHISHVSGEKEYYIPLKHQVINCIRTLSGLLLMFSIVLLLILLNTLYRVEVTKLINNSDISGIKRHKAFFIMSTSAIIGTVIITFLGPYFTKLSVYLTNKENPKTYVDFLNACIYKVYATSFANGYFPFFYVAFIKGAFFTHPGDMNVYDRFGLRTDICNVNGCAYALTISLLFFFALKNSTQRLLRALIPIVREKMKKARAKRRGIKRPKNLATWERDYHLLKVNDLFMLGLFMSVTMQYGYVLFFISALQLTPMMALITNIVNLRVDAIHVLKNLRRPVAKQLPGIGAWNNIFNIVTYVGTASNAFVIAFTSGLWQREIYRHFNSDLTGYVNSTLSEFAIKDYHQNVSHILKTDGYSKEEVCVYSGKRYPYYHEDKYQHSDDYWHVLTYKLGFVVVYEQLLWFIISMVSIFRESIPPTIKEHLRDEKFNMKAARFQFLSEAPPVQKSSSDIEIVEDLDDNTYNAPHEHTNYVMDDNYYIP